jgi:hypothetical protein
MLKADYDAVLSWRSWSIMGLATDASSSALIEAFIRITNLLLYVIRQQLKNVKVNGNFS